MPTRICEKISIQGLVQGVGFRPTVWQLAHEFNLTGEVFNDGQGVQIIAQAKPDDLTQFIEQLRTRCPPLARIDQVSRSNCNQTPAYEEFSITESQNTAVQTGIVADAATCAHCLTEINDPANRRFEYAFTNCTHCGPRLSIVSNIPYDRNNTSMARFTLCPDCQQEYDNPADRRFHAQPNACPRCGPVLQLVDGHQNTVVTENEIQATANLIEQGYIIAIKGIGGFQLACDAGNDQVVQTLRRRKQRPSKALALMATSTDQISDFCEVDDIEAAALNSSAAPIVVLKTHHGAAHLSDHLAPGTLSLGFMLPYSPLHHLLMQYLPRPIVLTSGNLSEEPQSIDNRDAFTRLGKIADYFLMHDRDILNRVDDSVVRVVDSSLQYYRRARGYAPSPINLPGNLTATHPILACGGELKNTFGLLRGQHVTLSQHMGNLENAQTYDDYLKNLDLFKRLYEFTPEVIAVDGHPEYLSTKFGRHLAQELGAPLIEAQHHHAHIASCMIDNGWAPEQGPVLGVALDGLGFGTDDTIWGGEFIQADYGSFTRLGCLKPVPLLGGSKAMLEPWRNTYAHLISFCEWHDLNQDYAALDLFQYLNEKPLSTLDRMMASQTNVPLSSSCGRLFDAMAAALGICRDRISYEGQAAIELEALVDPNLLKRLTPYPIEIEHGDLHQISPALMWQAILEELKNRLSKQHIATRFHLTIAHMIRVMINQLHQQTGISSVALSGGVFQNPTLLSLTRQLLLQDQFQVLCHAQVPANDGGLALGQAAIAAARIKELW
ncbi:MAG: carbamoyltransferase HypF [Gammaproteobacteria bacterium]|nr:carbamoyltransferase HypF [Gammaproteobacteria bacterium]